MFYRHTKDVKNGTVVDIKKLESRGKVLAQNWRSSYLVCTVVFNDTKIGKKNYLDANWFLNDVDIQLILEFNNSIG